MDVKLLQGRDREEVPAAGGEQGAALCSIPGSRSSRWCCCSARMVLARAEIQTDISGVLAPSQVSGRDTCTPKSLFQTLFPSPQQPLSAPARQLAGVAVTGFISTKLCSWAEPWAGPASPAQASQDTASLSLLFVSGKWSSYCPKRHQGALIKPGGSRCPIFTSPSSPGMQLKLL